MSLTENTITQIPINKSKTDMNGMFFNIQQYFTNKALTWVMENYTITNEGESLTMEEILNKYNLETKAQEFEPKKTKKTKKKKELTPEEMEEKEKKRCKASKVVNKDGIILQCNMSKLTNPTNEENPDMCSNHNRQLLNGKDVQMYNPEIHGPENPNKKEKKKKRKKSETQDMVSEDMVSELVNEISKESEDDKDDLDDFINISKKIIENNECKFVYTRGTGEHKAGDKCNEINCKIASHKKNKSKIQNIPKVKPEREMEIDFECESDNESEHSVE